MSLSTPSTATIAANILAQLEGALGQTVPLLPKAFARVLSTTTAGVFTLLYKYAGFSLLQMFPRTASFRETVVNGRTVRPLVEWGRLVGVGDPTPATRAELLVEITVTLQTGVLPAGSQLLFASTGVLYQTMASVALDAATKQVRVKATSDPDGNGGAGTIGNLVASDVLSFASPLANVSRNAVVVSQAVTGADAESAETYRSRVIDRFRRRPQGGAYSDYREWGEELAGILNVYPYTSNPGEVDVYVEATVASSGSTDGIPTGAQLTAVADAIDLDVAGLASRRPVNAAVNVLPIVRTGFDVEVIGLSAPDLPVAQAAIAVAVDEYFRSREPYIVGLSALPRRDRITQAAIAGVVDDVANAVGGSVTSVAVSLGGGALLAQSLGQGEKAKLANPVSFS